ncbi:MAG: hypothetical protein IT229_07210 [Flavobacteriales bacterium]|nr:hypothetical protein [Flavobacteriales bacterium]
MRAPVEYYKEVLSKISFADRATFRKELKKAFRLLGAEEREELKRWFRSMCLCRTPQPVLERVKTSLRNLS